MIRYFINNGIAVTVLCIAIVLFGILSLFRLPIQLTPDVTTPAITVTTIYPGATPQDVEQDIVENQEEFLRSVPGLQKMTSSSNMGQAEIILEFAVGSDMSENLVRVSNALQQVADYPENVDEPSLSTSSSSDQPVAWFSIRARPGQVDEVDVSQFFDYAEDFIKPQFERVEGVASVQGVYGGSSKQMQVYIDPYKLAERDLTIMDIRNAIRDNNRDIPGGDLEEGKRRYNVRTKGRFRSPLDVENAIIEVRDGVPIHIRDIGYAQVGTAKMRSLIRHNGRPAMALGVRHQPGTNLLQVMDDVKAVTKELNETVLKDKGLFLTQVTDDTEYVRDSVDMVQSNLLTGGILALITLLIFLRHIRSTVIIGVAVPICVMGAIVLVSLSGRSINVITLAGIAFSIGAVLDNSIVVLENIFRHREMGKAAPEAAYDGTSEVWTAIFSSTVTNVVVFVPIMTLQEQAGQLFRDLAIAITSANVFSFIVAVLVIPCLASKLLTRDVNTKKTSKNHWYAPIADFFARAGEGTYRLVENGLTRILRSLTARIALVGGMIGLAAFLLFVFMPKTEYLPEGNQNSIFAMLIPPQGYALQEMSAIGSELEDRFRPYVEGSVEDFETGKLDGPPIKDFFFVAFGTRMFMFTRAKDAQYADQVPDLMQRILSEVPGTIAIATQFSIFDRSISGSRGVDLDIIGPDMATTTGIAAGAFFKTLEELGTPPQPDPGIEVGQPELSLIPRWERAQELGISATAIGYGAWVLGDGAYADDYYEDGKKYDLYLYSTLGAFDTLTTFDSLRISTGDGKTVPISDIADIEFTFVPESIRRVDGQRAVTLSISPPSDISLEEAIEVIENDIVGALQEEGSVPPGYSLRIGGSSDKLAAIREELGGDFLLAIALVYLVLVLIFHNWGHPFTVLLAVPIGLTGGVLGLKLLNVYLGLTQEGVIQSLDVLTMLGFVILLGSVVNNPILIVEQTVNFLKQGLEVNDAITQATLTRIRPIFMTTSTTILGLSPLVLLPGAGSELYRGLGVVMFGGLLLATFTVIVFIPCVLSLMFGLSKRLQKSEVFKHSSEMVHRLEEG